MPRGGARSVSGPPPDPNALRRDRPSDAAGWVTLPSEGPSEPAPVFPLLNPTEREYEVWDELWQKPQAHMWHALDQEWEVAFFVRKLVEAEKPKASVELRKSIRQDFDSLGLSVQGMLRNRWRIAGVSSDEGSGEDPSPPPRRRRSPRDRLKVVPSGDS